MALGIPEMMNQLAQRELAFTIDHKVRFRKHLKQSSGGFSCKHGPAYHNGEIRGPLLDALDKIEGGCELTKAY